MVERLVRVADDRVLGRGRSEELPMVAAEALARGVDSPALRELAGLGRSDVREAAELFERAMAELGHPPRSKDAVAWARIRDIADRLFTRRAAPPNAAEDIAALLCGLAESDERTDDLALRLVVLSDLWLDQPADRPATVADILSTVSEIRDL
ncbi:hypothetical protein O7635_29820 [Asanoa sp. WMMD1127]|uniref:hypothetical protein n=1 Tax=Asanoa sp. WMMD1127 TaxID=3016107 RepID=UPI002415FE9D|nr:hypothetical protein [Asanoa sp. WMMD1127]MDG4826067.1 hypothetical protein [Asanoa sp. WMMD1127]